MKLFQMSEGRKTEIVLVDGRKFGMLIQVTVYTWSVLSAFVLIS